MSRASATPPVPSEDASPTRSQDPRSGRVATPGPCGPLPGSRPGCSSLRSRRVEGSRRGEAAESGPSPEPRPPKLAARGRRWAPPGRAEGVRSASKHHQGGVPAGWAGARPPPGRGSDRPGHRRDAPRRRPAAPHTHQDPLEERVLLGREAHGRHGSGSSRGSRHRPARSGRPSVRRHCRSRAGLSLGSFAPPPLGLGCRRAALA